MLQARRERIELEAARGAGAQLLSANKLYAEKTYALRPDFLGYAEQGFDAKSENVDFLHAAEPARGAINKWVADKTAGKIIDLIPPGGLDDQTRLVLTNAVYFKAGWMTAFPAGNTRSDAFFESATQSAPVPTMHRDGNMRYAATPTFKVIELPYTGTGVVMNILLPNEKAGLAKLEAELSVATLARALESLRGVEVELSLPKFGFSWGADLVPSLKSLGIELPFDRRAADFTGMSDAKGDERLYLAKVFHKAFIKVDEQGTEAAAATAAVMATKGMAMPQTPVAFRADHPFLFVIRDFGSGRIYFMGRVVSPKTN
jgi:serpin B